MDANAAAADEIKGDFHKVVSRVVLVVVHHGSAESHTVVIESGATHAKLLVDFDIHLMGFVVA